MANKKKKQAKKLASAQQTKKPNSKAKSNKPKSSKKKKSNSVKSTTKPKQTKLKQKASKINEAQKQTTYFSQKLEEVIKKTQPEQSKIGDKIVIIGSSAKELTKKWRGFWKNFANGLVRFLVAIIILCIVAGSVIGMEVWSHNRVLPRVAVSKMDYSFMPITEARHNITSRFENFQQQSFIFRYNDKQVAIPLTELEIRLLTAETIEAIPYFQFTKDNYLKILASAIVDRDIVPRFHKNDKHIFALLENKLGLTAERAASAQLRKTEAGTIILVPEKEGIILNQSTLQKSIVNRIYQLSTQEIAVNTLRELPEVTTTDLEKGLPDIQVKLENEITIKHNDKEWKFRPLDHLEGITFRKNNDEIIITVTPELLDNAFGEDIFSQTEVKVSNLKIHYDENENIVFEGKAINGEEVNRSKLINDLEMAINSLDQEVSLEVNQRVAQVEVDKDLQELGIKELLGTGHTSFSGSPSNRRHNIAVGMAKFNGLLIKPGDTFSFNDNLGEVDGSTGYKLELVIKAEGTVPEYGGGICQVSSTMFKAGLFTGLPIVERSPHSYAVSYYAQVDGYGLDSTIYPGVKDLKLLNDTPGHILIQTFVEGDNAYINFFGTSDGREVRLENYWRGNWRGAGGTQYIPTKTLPPGAKKQIESAHSGFDASWDRVITKNGEEMVENIYSVYRATSNRILVGEGGGGEQT